MKVVLISSNSSPRGGGEDFIIYLARVLSKFYKKTLFAIYSDKAYMNNFVSNISQYSNKITRINYNELSKRKLRFFSSIFDLKQIFRIYKAINKINPNLIIINQQYDEDALDILISSIFYKIINYSTSVKIACIMHMPRVRNKIIRQPLGQSRYIFLLIFYGLLKPNFLLTSKECLEEFQKYYFLNKKKSFLMRSPLPDIKSNISKKYSIEIIKNSEIPEYAKNKLAKWVKTKRQIILLGCQMKTQKNPLFALSCWIKYRNLYKSNVCFLIIGDGPLKNEISKRIANLSDKDREDTLQINWVKELSRYILIADLLLMPSSFEGMNLTLLESISYNKDIILSKFEGINEIKDFAKCCELINLFDEKLWAKKIHKILSSQIKQKNKNILNNKFIYHYSDRECLNSIQKSINLS